MTLILQDNNGKVVSELSQIYMPLEFYKPELHCKIHCVDNSPSPIMTIYTSSNQDETCASLDMKIEEAKRNFKS